MRGHAAQGRPSGQGCGHAAQRSHAATDASPDGAACQRGWNRTPTVCSGSRSSLTLSRRTAPSSRSTETFPSHCTSPRRPAEAVVALAVRQPKPDLRRADEPVAEYRNPVAELPVDLPARRDMAAQIPPGPHRAADRPRHRYQRSVPRSIIAWSVSSPVSLRVPSRSRFRVGPSDQPTPARQVRPPPSVSERPA